MTVFCKFALYAARLYSSIGAVVLLFAIIGQALTGGMRLEARAVAKMMDPTDAVTMTLWLVCIVLSAVAPREAD